MTGRQCDICFYLALLALSALSSLGCSKSAAHRSGNGDEGFQIVVQEWTDESTDLSSHAIEKLMKLLVVSELPHLDNGEHPVLFVRGSIQEDKAGSVMVLEGKFLFRIANKTAHLPVKVVVMGSIEGNDAARRKRLVRGVLSDMKSALESNIRICNGSEKDWVAALDSPEPDEQILALSILKNNNVKSAAFRVIELLDDPRGEVSQAAAETAASLAGQQHVNRIIQIAHKGGLEGEARCIQVLSSIGGADAIAWLEMLAVGHQNSQLRELSFNALKRLK